MIAALVGVASLLCALLVLAHLGRYAIHTHFLPLLVRNGLCESCMKLSLRGELSYPSRPLSLRAEAAFGVGYLIVKILGIRDATMDYGLDEMKRQIRLGSESFESIRPLLHPDCQRGRCACGIPRCDGHGPDEKIVMATHPGDGTCSCPGCSAVLSEDELKALETARLQPPDAP